MGLENNSNNKTYLSVYDGKLERRLQSKTEGCVTRKITKGANEGKEIYVLHFDKLTGVRITSIAKEVHDSFGVQFRINLQEGDTEYCLTINYSLARGLFFRLPNLDPNQNVDIIVGKTHDEEKGKDFTWLTVRQNQNKIERAFTRDNKNGLPDLEKILVKGKETWDDTKQMQWVVDNPVQQFLDKIVVPSIESNIDSTTVSSDFQVGDPTDDLPF